MVGDDRGSSERARKRQGKITTHMLAGTGAAVAGEGSTRALFGCRRAAFERVTAAICEYVEKSNTTKIHRSYDGSSGRRMKWLEMFDWKGNCQV